MILNRLFNRRRRHGPPDVTENDDNRQTQIKALSPQSASPLHHLDLSRNSPSALPLHTLDLSPNPQSASPLYNGRVPQEIRDLIYAFALSEYTKRDPKSEYPPSTNYTRPGYTGKRTITFAILQTCKRMYLETYHLPPVSKEHVFWHRRWPDDHYMASIYGDAQECHYFAQLRIWQLDLVREIHLFTQLFWLEDSFVQLSKERFLQKIEKVKITVRAGDWWWNERWNERNAPLILNPYRGDGTRPPVLEDIQASSPIPGRDQGWGYAFRNLKGLKELELELESTEDKLEELRRVAGKAKTWKFPMDGEMYLSAKGLETKTSEWRSPQICWAAICPYCGRRGCPGAPGGFNRSLDERCVRKVDLKTHGLGLICKVISLRYKLAKA